MPTTTVRIKDNKLFAKVLAVQARNRLEDLHVEGHISQFLMKKINISITQGIYDALETFRKAGGGNKKEREGAEWMIRVVPDYWEDPKEVNNK